MLGAGATFFTQMILARNLGPADYGAFAAVLAAVNLVAPLAGFGIAGFWLKVFGKEGWGGLRWVRPSLTFSLVSTLGATMLILGWAFLGPHNDASTQMFVTLSFCVAGQAVLEINSARLQLEEQYARLAVWQFTPHALRLASVGVFALYFGSALSATAVATAYTLVAVVLVALGAVPLTRMVRGDFALKGHGERPRGNVASDSAECGIAKVFREAWPFGLAGAFYFIYFQSDIVLLKYLAGDEEAGLYNVAFLIMAALYLFPSVIYQKYLLPKIHRWANHDLPMLRQVYRKGNRIMAVAGLLAMLFVMMLGPYAIPLLFGVAFVESAVPMKILSIAIPLRFVATSVGAMLVTRDNMKRKVGYMGTVAVINVMLNLILIPNYGVIGAAAATVTSEAMLLLIYSVAVKRFVFTNQFQSDQNAP